MTILTYYAGYFVLCAAVAAVIIFANFLWAMATLLIAIAAVTAFVFKPNRLVRHG